MRSGAYLVTSRAVSKSSPFIAVVDDEESVLKALERLLRSAGFDVEKFGSGAEFLRALDDRIPTCLVLDLHMPQITGFEVQSRLAARHSGVPVVVITGQDSSEARERAIEGGAAAYLRKPVEGQALLDAVARAIQEGPPPSGRLKTINPE